MFLFLAKAFDMWQFIVNLKIIATTAAIAALIGISPTGSLPVNLTNPALLQSFY